MKKTIKRLIALALVLATLGGFAVPAAAASGTDTSDVGALLDTFTANGETFNLTADSRIFVVSDSAPTGKLLRTVQLAQQQFAAAGRPTGEVMPIVWGPESYAWEGDIVVMLDSSSGIAADGYALDITTSAKITAGDTDGLLYGLNMLLKHMEYAGSNSICGFSAKDEPDTKERTVHLDCGRKYFTKTWICNFIRQMSWMGYNALEFHFSEDGGFRADFWDPNYYKGSFQPENDFTWVCGSLSASWVLSDYWKGYENEDYLTAAELVEICNTAAKYNIEIIPSFDSPAHVDYLTWIFEQNYNNNNSYSFTYNGNTYEASDVGGCINYSGVTGYSSVAKWPYYSSLNIKSDVAKNFIFAMYTDIANFFKVYAGSRKFNIGADEVNLTACTPKWTYADFPAYVNELDNLLNGLGYTTRIFNDFIGTTNSEYTNSGVTIDDFNSDIEILYWNSPFEPRPAGYQYPSENLVQPVTYFTNDNRTLYNVVQTSTYYCTRMTSSGGVDARDPAVRRWQIFHAQEDLIYDEWYPGDFGEKGDNSETVLVDSSNIGGAYFCLWFDHQALSTESKIWKGEDSNGKWNVIDRMWSNVIKMWNWDVNLGTNSMGEVSYDSFASIRDTISYFPGYTDCSKAASLPSATAAVQATLADHTELTAALETKTESAPYTTESYAAYEAAYAAAQEVNANPAATAEEVQAALEALAAAEAALEERGQEIQVTFMSKSSADEADDAAVLIKTETFEFTPGEYSVYIEPLKGYTFLKASGTTFVPTASGDGSGQITGNSQYGITATLYYLITPDTSELEYLVRNEVTDSENYTEESWNAYQTALAAAKAFELSGEHDQADVDALIKALQDAEQALVAVHEGESTVDIQVLTPTARLGKKIGLVVTTSPDVTALSFGGKTASLCVSNIQTLSSGETVKLWLVYIPADQAGTETITVTGTAGENTVSGSAEITVK